MNGPRITANSAAYIVLTEESLRAILRDPSFPRESRMAAFRLLARFTYMGTLFRAIKNINDFREQTGGCYLPELMVA